MPLFCPAYPASPGMKLADDNWYAGPSLTPRSNEPRKVDLMNESTGVGLANRVY
jgi:hypothetical protein